LRLGQIFAFVIAVVGLLCAAYCVVHAKTSGGAWAGASIGGVSLATLVGIFIYGRKSRATVQDAEDQAHSEK
jgi:formate hydrogenlyase subunit 3/multisubunit Na+/H+ antiporter MnhD subunit